MALKLLNRGTEDERRWKIIDVSRTKDSRYLPQLHALLYSDETIDNKRHAIRAIGNIASIDSKAILLEMIQQEEGLILGDICRAIKALEMCEAIEFIKPLLNHKKSWVQQEAQSTLKRLKAIMK